jgi:hypothetical protein
VPTPPPPPLAALAVRLVETLPEVQRRMDQARAANLAPLAAQPAVRALLGEAAVPRLARATITVEALLDHEQSSGLHVGIWPLGVGFAVLHQVAERHAARIAIDVAAVRLHAAPPQPEPATTRTPA